MIRVGQQFRHYYVIDEIASGGMASVCLAYDLKHHRFVALKTIFTQLAEDEVFVKRLQREGDIYQGLRHPNIITVLEAQYDKLPYLALEYIHGRTLADLIAHAPEGFVLSEAVSVLQDITNALFQAHANGIIHRDLQPQNVLVDQSGLVKLFDFGIAYADDNLLQTMTGTIMGTILYSSPEQNQGKHVDERSDLYSLGMVFYEMVTGKPAVKGQNLNEVLAAKLEGEITSPDSIRPGLPKSLVNMTMRLLNKAPEKRFKSIRHLLDFLIDLRIGCTPGEAAEIFGDEVAELLAKSKRALAVGKCEEALEEARRYADQREMDAPLLYLMARIYRGMGDLAKAKQVIEKAVEMKGARSEYWLEYATLKHELGDEAGALEIARKVIENFPRHPCARGLVDALGGPEAEGPSLDAAHEKLEAEPKKEEEAVGESEGDTGAEVGAEAEPSATPEGEPKAEEKPKKKRGVKEVIGAWLRGKR